MKARMGLTWGQSINYSCITSALKQVPVEGDGYLWVFCNNQWHIVGVYLGGVMFHGNGRPCRVATVEGLAWVARQR